MKSKLLNETGVIQFGMLIKTVNDLEPFRVPYQQGSIKLNVSEIARTLNKDRRTIKKLLNQTTMIQEACNHKRNKVSELDQHHEFLVALLNDSNKSFLFMSHLYDYMVKAKKITVSYGAFTHYIRKDPTLSQHFKDDQRNRVHVRLETKIGGEAQIDWKENIRIVLNTGKEVSVNILVLILSHSRYRIAKMTTDKSQPVLFHLLTEIFEELGGVPESIKCDNMKTIMDVAKTEYHDGVINTKFAHFALDMGFEIVPCKSFNPQLKGRVEQPNRLYDRLPNFNGEYSLMEFNMLVKEITTNENTRYHESYHLNPIIEFSHEKKTLNPLPPKEIRANYKLTVEKRIVSNTALVFFKNRKYSVPPEYIGQQVLVRQVESLIHIYSNTNDPVEIAVHLQLTEQGKEYVYLPDHLNALKELKFGNTHKQIEDKTQANLQALDKVIGGIDEQ